MKKSRLFVPSVLWLVFLTLNCELGGKAKEEKPANFHQSSMDAQPQVSAPPNTLPSPRENWLEYWPAIVELKGILTLETFYGPPNFGENPETDSKETHWVVILNTPKNVRGRDDPDPGLNITVENVRKVQLVVNKTQPDLVGKEVIVKGTLFHAHTGHHHTDVLMTVESLDPASRTLPSR